MSYIVHSKPFQPWKKLALSLSLSLSLSTLAWCAAGLTAMAQNGAPPDPYGDADNPNYCVVPNVGQVMNDLGEAEPDIAYYASGGTYFQKKGLISLVVTSTDTVEGVETQRRLDITCDGRKANHPDPEAFILRDHVYNFYLPQCGSEGATDVSVYGMVKYAEIYPNIDLYVHGSINGQKLAFVVRPGGDPENIQLMLQGQESMEVDETGDLRIFVENQTILFPSIYTFQTDSAGSIYPVDWEAEYQANTDEGKVTFSNGEFDHSGSLVFLIGPPAAMPPCCTWTTPGLCWSTFYGAELWDYPKDVKADLAGNIYVAGRTTSQFANFPHFPGAFTTALGSSVATLTKFDSQHFLKWTIFHGGTGNVNSTSSGSAVAVKETASQVYMVGTTNAGDFFTQASPGAYNSPGYNNNNLKGFVARYNGSNGALQWSTYIGGDQDVQVQAIDIVPTTTPTRIVISGLASNNLDLGNFLPPSNGYSFSANHGGRDAFVALFNCSDGILASAYYGGSLDESLALVRYGGKSITLAGNTTSTDLLVGGPGTSFTEGYHEQTDVFIAQISLTGSLTWATYFGSAGNDLLAPQGMCQPKDLYLTGTCGTLPNTVNGTDWFDNVPAAQGVNGFIARFNEDIHNPKWITYLGDGANGQHSPYCITASPFSSTYATMIVVGGYTDDTSFPITNLNGFYNQPTIVPDQGANKDGFLVLFNDAQHLVWGSYFGGQGGSQTQPENVTGVAYQNPSMGQASKIYAVGYTSQPTATVVTPIPLDGNTYSGMFFNPNYNFNASGGNFTDGFITQICNDFLPFQEPMSGADVVPPERDFILSWTPSGELVLMDLSDGMHQIRIYDAQGRLIVDRQVRSNAGHSESVSLADNGAALYLVVVDNTRTGRIVTIH